jgi:hypothetical protein
MTQVGAGPRFSAAPTALPRHAPRQAGTGGAGRSSSGLIPSPSGLGLSFGDRPSGPRIYRDFRSVICQLATGTLHGRLHGRPGQAGQAG